MSCPKNKVINPKTGRCVNKNSPVLKKNKPKRACPENKVINPKTGRCVNKNSPVLKDKSKNPKKDKEKDKEKNQIKNYPPLELDTDSDNYISIKEYLSAIESKGPLEKPGRGFIDYAAMNFSIVFLLKLLQKQKTAPINHVACIPNYVLCIDPDTGKVEKSEIDENGNLICRVNPTSVSFRRASIELINAPKYYRMTVNESPMELLIPPNFKSVINNCSDDNKTIVICELILNRGNLWEPTKHANALVINLFQKTIERFDPYGGNYYIPVGNKSSDNKKLSTAYFNSNEIDDYLTKQFNTILPGYKYLGPDVTCPYLGPQIKTDAFKGLCLTWSTMYMILRILNYKLSPEIITKKMITGTKEQLLSKLLRFQKFMIDTVKS